MSAFSFHCWVIVGLSAVIGFIVWLMTIGMGIRDGNEFIAIVIGIIAGCFIDRAVPFHH